MVAVAAEVPPVRALLAICDALGMPEREYSDTLGCPDPVERAALAEALDAALPAILADLKGP